MESEASNIFVDFKQIVLCPPCTNETLLNSLQEGAADSLNDSRTDDGVFVTGWPPFSEFEEPNVPHVRACMCHHVTVTLM